MPLGIPFRHSLLQGPLPDLQGGIWSLLKFMGVAHFYSSAAPRVQNRGAFILLDSPAFDTGLGAQQAFDRCLLS